MQFELSIEIGRPFKRAASSSPRTDCSWAARAARPTRRSSVIWRRWRRPSIQPCCSCARIEVRPTSTRCSILPGRRGSSSAPTPCSSSCRSRSGDRSSVPRAPHHARTVRGRLERHGLRGGQALYGDAGDVRASNRAVRVRGSRYALPRHGVRSCLGGEARVARRRHAVRAVDRDRETVQACRELLTTHGLFVGGSSGTAYAAVKRYMATLATSEHPTVLFVCADRGTPYLDTVFDPAWAARLE